MLEDGDFSEATFPTGPFKTYRDGQIFARQWRVTLRTIDLYGNGFKTPSGVCSVDLDGMPGVGAIAHAPLATTPSVGYIVYFELSGNGACPPTVKTVELKAGDQSTTYTWNTANGNDAQHGAFAQKSTIFIAHSTLSTLEFTSADPNPRSARCGPVVAAVQVNPA
jgi:hypothetical protein